MSIIPSRGHVEDKPVLDGHLAPRLFAFSAVVLSIVGAEQGNFSHATVLRAVDKLLTLETRPLCSTSTGESVAPPPYIYIIYIYIYIYIWYEY